MQEENYEIDSIDRQIISTLQSDARTPYLEIARDIGVSGGTIHQRVDRLKKLGVIIGSRIEIDESKLGYGVISLVGVHLNQAQDYQELLLNLSRLDEVVEAHYTTGTYAIVIKVAVKNMNDFYEFMTGKLQKIRSVRSTESFICLKTPVNRQVKP